MRDVDTMAATVEPLAPDDPARFLNRELSWLAFNARVLAAAQNPRHPLLERVKFLAIFSTNLDEFFMVRVAGLREQGASDPHHRSPDGRTPGEQLATIRATVTDLLIHQRQYWQTTIHPALRTAGIEVCDYAELSAAQHAACTDYFATAIFPVLTPLAIDTSHPFPHISNLSLSLAVAVRDDTHGERFARVKVPATLPRLMPLPGEPDATSPCTFIWLEQLVGAHLDMLFPGQEIVEYYPFRVTRDTDVEIAEDETGDLLASIAQSVLQRRFGAVVRLTIPPEMPERIRTLLQRNLQIYPEDIYYYNAGSLKYEWNVTIMR